MPEFLNKLIAVICTSSVLSWIHNAAFTSSFPYGSEKVRGVNLGGWLVLEPWITPSIFDNTNDSRIIDEYTFGQYQDHDIASNTLKQHWDTWITESDFQAIANAGLNHVRLPIGYWAFDVSAGEPYIQGQLPYLYKAVNWAQTYGLKVIIDLHGAPGSQNGFDNSGQTLPFPQWQTQTSYVQRTNAIIKTLANMYKDSPVASVITPLNEPAGFDGEQVLNVTKQYYYDSYGNIRYPYGSSRQSNNIVMIQDAFQPATYWNGFMPPPQFQGVILDTHIYQTFSNEMNAWSFDQHIQAACETKSNLTVSQLWLVVGEWSPAPNDCAPSLNGPGTGSRYAGTFPNSTRVGSCEGLTGKGSTFSSDYKTFLRKFWEAQAITYEAVQGWLQWTWKTEDADEWSYSAGLAYGWIPQDPTDRRYPDICG
jgi:glucan 1,3-beta-glucosidase